MAVTKTSQGFMGLGTNAQNPSIALADATTGTGAVIGIDGSDGKFKVLATTSNPSTVSGAQFGIDPTANGHIFLTPNGSGTVDITAANVISGTATLTSATIGNVSYGTGSISTTNNALTINTGTGTINIATDNTVSTVNIGTGSSDKNIFIGSVSNTTGVMEIIGGTQSIILNPAGSSASFLVGASGTLNLATDSVTCSVNVGTNGTKTVVIGSGSGSIALNAAGAITAQPATNSTNTATSTINSHLSVSTFTGFTTASGASQVFTISNTTVTITSGIKVTCANLNASTNGALMQIQGITQATNSLAITTKNVGAGALGAGDNVLITVWVIS